MLDRLKSLRAQGKLGAAEATFSRIVAETPGHLHAWLGLGYCLSLSGDANAALRAFEKRLAHLARHIGFHPDFEFDSFIRDSKLTVREIRPSNLFGYWKLLRCVNQKDASTLN